jgi:hypothetical protein
MYNVGTRIEPMWNFEFLRYSFLVHSGSVFSSHACNLHQVKGKAIPLLAWTGPEGSRKLRLPNFKTVGT